MMNNKKNKITPFKITCSVLSRIHILNSEAFSLLMSDKSNIIVSEVAERSFSLSCVNATSYGNELGDFAKIAHLCLSNFIMALNILTMGHFIWNWEKSFPSVYKLVDPLNGKIKMSISLKKEKKKDNFIRNITKKDVDNAILLYPALANERDSNIRIEYIKGILHLSFNLFEIDFLREAFGNFYRSFEFFSTQRILKVKKLGNELKDMQKVIIDLGLGDDIADEFSSLYRLRSNQIMHAQKKQVNIEEDDVLKMKSILDATLFKVYQPIWERGIKDLIKKSKNEEEYKNFNSLKGELK